jgi:tetratricopeptide (TPR) repeat protein
VSTVAQAPGRVLAQLALSAVFMVTACGKKPGSSPTRTAPTPAAPASTSNGSTTSPSDHYAAAKRALEAGQLDEAEARFRAAADAPPQNGDDPALRANALLGLASLRKERGDPKGALAFAQQVVALRPDDDDALDVLVDLAHQAGDLPAEIAGRERIIRNHPDALDERLALAGALTAAKDPERAKDAFLGYEAMRLQLVVTLGRSPEVAARRAAARALGAAHDAGTARALVLAMTDRDAGVRMDAVRAVGSVGLDLDPEVRPALRKLSSLEKDAEVQTALREVLAPRH